MQHARFGGLALLLALGVQVFAAGDEPRDRVAAAPDSAPRIEEAVVTVSSLERTLPAFVQALKWHVILRGRLTHEESRALGLPTGLNARQVLVGSPSSGYGRVRLIELPGPAEPMRPAAHWWDTGGANALNFFVSDAAAALRDLRALGWTTALPLQEYAEQAGGSAAARGRYARAMGPDDLVIGFQERIAPPLSRWPRFHGASHLENVMECVDDLASWTAISSALLGADPVQSVARTVTNKILGAIPYGLPQNLADRSDATQSILRLGESSEQTLTAWHFISLQGVSYAPQIDAAHYGVLALRIGVVDAAASVVRLAALGAFPGEPGNAGLQGLQLRPYGKINSVMVRAGGGSRLILVAQSRVAQSGQ